MIDWFVSQLREYPPLVLFLTIGLGFLLGRIKFGKFQLGSVTSVLLVGVVIGQLDIPISGPIKAFFFMMFLFSIGYSVGPDFFKSLRGTGLKQVFFAILMSASCFGITLLISFIFSYSKGETVGLFSGSETCSALLGVGSEAIQKLGYEKSVLDREMSIIPVCYAVTYIFGTLGTVILLGNFGPRLLGGLDKVKQQAIELEKSLSRANSSADPAILNAGREVGFRSYRLGGATFSEPLTVRETENMLRSHGLEVYIDRMERNGEISMSRYDDILQPGDEIVVCGRIEFMINVAPLLGEETINRPLLDYPVARVGVVVAKDEFIGRPITDLRREDFMHGVVVRDAVCNKTGPIEIDIKTQFKKGDRLTVICREDKMTEVTSHIGHIDRPTVASDLVFVGLAIFLGGFFGAITFWIDSIPVSFGTSGGALVAGLVFGWLRSKRPTYGQIPKGALWMMNNLGLNVFIAVIGLDSATSFVSGLKAVGPFLFIAGAICTLVPLFFGLWLGHKVFKFNPAITLGCCAGTRTCTASLGAVQTTIGSTVPTIVHSHLRCQQPSACHLGTGHRYPCTIAPKFDCRRCILIN